MEIRQKNFFIISSVFLILISFWILNHPYKGIIHDSRLYTLQALSHIKPEIFKNDLFLRYDSQETYTVFSYLYTFIITLTNPVAANIILFIIGHLFWFVSAWLFAGIFNKGALKVLSFAFAVTMPAFYGAKHIFSFGEPFLTPRIFAEALVLFSLFFVLKKRFVLCAVMLALSFLLHPIMACTGAMFLCVYFFFKHRKPTIIVGLILLVLFAIPALFGIAPFDRILQCMDAGWADIVQTYKNHLFVSSWPLRDIVPTMVSFLAVFLYAVMNRGKRRAVAISLIASTGLSLFLSLCLGDYLKNVLVLQVQLWRTSWLLLFFSYLALPSLYVKIRKHSNFGTSFVAVFCAAWLSPFTSVFSMQYTFLTLIEFLIALTTYHKETTYFLWRSGWKKIFLTEDFRKKLNTLMIIIAVAALSCDVALLHFVRIKLNHSLSVVRLLPDYNAIVAMLLMLVAGIPLLFFQLRQKNKSLIVFSAAFFFISLLLWDQRLEHEKMFEKTIGVGQPDIAEKIPANSEILWVDNPELSWFLANRKNYVSRLQASGIVFSRDTALLVDKRMKNIGLLTYVMDYPIRLYKKYPPIHMDIFYAHAIKKCCTNAQDLDFIIAAYELPHYRPVKILSVETMRVYFNTIILEYKNFNWYLYNCSRIRSLASK